MILIFGDKEVPANDCYKFMAIFIEFPGFCLKILQEPPREPCDQKEIVAVTFLSEMPSLERKTTI